MSVIENDRIAEDLFERLEALEPVMNRYQYVECQQDLLRTLAAGGFEEASEAVIKWEQDYSGLLADAQADDALDALSDSISASPPIHITRNSLMSSDAQSILEAALAAKTQIDDLIIEVDIKLLEEN